MTSALATLALAAACSSASGRTQPTAAPTVALVPAHATAAGPDLALHAHPFGVPVQLRADLSAVVRDLYVYQPVPALPGSAGTPVALDLFVTAKARSAAPHATTLVTLTDPTTGRACPPAPGGSAATRVTSPPHVPNQTVLHQINFICPEQVRTDLLVTLRNGSVTRTFSGPLA